MLLRNNIAFDLDSTLVDLTTVFNTVLDEMFPGHRKLNVDSFQIHTEPALTNKEIWWVFYEVFPRVKDLKPFPGAIETLEKLYQYTGDPISIITARPMNFATETYRLVHRIMGSIPYSLHITQDSREKIKYLHGIDYFVDDRRRTAIELAENGKHVYLVDRPWNQELPDLSPKVFHSITRIAEVEALKPIIEWFIRNEGEPSL